MKNLLTLLFILVLNACTKNDATPQDQLPPATTIGANTAGCYINGELLIPKNGSQAIGGSPNYGLVKTQGNNFWPNKSDYWELDISNKKDFENLSVYVWIKNMQTGIGDYIIGQSNGELNSYGPNNNQIFAHIKKNGILKTYFSSTNSGIINIKRCDLGLGISIFSGTFNCTLYNKDNSSETIQIDNGRFDINGLTLNQ